MMNLLSYILIELFDVMGLMHVVYGCLFNDNYDDADTYPEGE